MQRDGKAGAWQERAAKLFVVLATLGVVYLVLDKAIRLVLPFLLAFLLSALIRPIAAFMQRRWRFPKKVAAIILLLLLLGSLVALLFFAFGRVALELQKLSERLSNNGELWGKRISEAMGVLRELTSHIPILSRLKGQGNLTQLWSWMDERIARLLSDTVARMSAQVPRLLGAFVRGIPSVAIFVLTFLLAAFYTCADGEKITQAMLGWLPKTWRDRLLESRGLLSRMGGRYLRAYFLLFLLTFLELFVGFSILRLPYTLLPALLIALLDVLPVLGVGTVLAPWGAIELLRGNGGLGTGILVLCGVIVVLRQICEPRIVGESLGLHPLATLFAAYVGLQLFGVLGMLLGPAGALLVKSLLGQGDLRGERGAQAICSDSLHPPKM